ncbi:methyl-accepting chemotaxis protein [Amphritea japonica]|uniref:Methyl-accepting chemotaxis protein n=2 Tax=Amphritea TaxID=515417 RepID=A0A7R6P8R2_9GAMM|nr:methyl-accepting chemotaxis protein [Amphritea japonica]BBB27924.1 methyl-accepting chemotaxis protein [Amphritea japonica ATCC BAA-1530]
MSSFWQMKTTNDRQIWEFRSIRMPVKFAVAGALLVIGLIFMGASFYQTVVIKEEAEARSQELNDFLLLVSDIRSNIALARYHEKSFQVDKDMAQLPLYNDTMAKVDSDIQTMKQYLRTEQDQALVARFQSVIDNYQDTFYDASEASVTAGLTADQGISGQINKLLWETDALIIWIQRDWLRSSFDTLKSNMNEYIASGGRTVTNDSVASQILRLKNQMEAAKAVKQFPQNRTAVINNLGEVALLFAELSDSVERGTGQFEQLQTIIVELEPFIGQVIKLADSYKVQNSDLQAEEVLSMVTYFFASMGLMLVAMAVAMSIVKYGVVDPVNKLQDTVNRIREGDVEARSRLEARDELGQLGLVLDNLLDEKELALTAKEDENKTLNNSIIELIKNVFLISQRDLTVRVPVAEDVTGAIADSINQLTTSIETVLNDVNAVSTRVNNASVQVKSQSETVLTYASKEQEEIVETLQGLDSAIKAMELISKLAVLTNNASQKAIKTSETAMDSVSQTIGSINKIRQTIHEAEKRIKRLGERSQEIGGIVNLINNISERTHVLSLNASMHAASAGEAGRGLMVVVDEVQRLAENSREATSEIESLVNNIQLETADTINVMNTVITDVVEGTRLAEEAGERMDETRSTTQTLVESVVRIAQNSARQAKVAKELRERAGKIDETTMATNKEMLQQAELSDELVDAAQELQRSVSVFKLAAPAVS